MGQGMSHFEERARMDAELTERAYAELGDSVLPPRRAGSRPAGESAQDTAACACLSYLGVTPGAIPDDVSDLDERLEYLCRPSGTMRREVKLDEGWQHDAFGALMGQLDTGEAVALIPAAYTGYRMIDAEGNSQRVTREIAKHIDQSATLFYRPFPNRALSMTDLLRFMVGCFGVSDCVRICVSALVATLVGMLPTWANNLIFTTVIPSGSMRYVAPIACLLAGVAISKVLMDTLRSFAVSHVVSKLALASESATYARVLMLPPSFFKEYGSGDLATRVSKVSTLAQTIVILVFGLGLTCLFSFIYLIQIWAYAPPLAIPAFAIAVAQILITVFGTVATMRYERASQAADAKLSGTEMSLLDGASKIKLAAAERRAFARWAKAYAAYARASYNRPAFVSALSAFATLVGSLGYAVIYFVAGDAGISVADYMSFSTAFGMMLSAASSLTSMATQLAQIGPMMELVEPIFSAVPEVGDDKRVVSTLTGAIEVSGVSFRYDEKTPYVLHDLSLSVAPGEYVAIVGKSGCGKSTLVRLLLGFERPEFGSIFYGSYDTGKVDLRSLRRSIGTVMQDSRLMSGSIQSNITVSMPLATVDDAWEAAELAGVADDIRKMPMGMQTQVTDGGGGVSGGQRQRIMIARAVCGKRKVLIFDEATSALDNVTQRQVADSLAGLGCTRIVVAHRLSTVKLCDRILVIDGGRIAEEGSYDELIAREGLFAELVRKQRLEGV